MSSITIKKWVPSSAIKLSESVLSSLNVKNNEELEFQIIGNKLILEKKIIIEELFKDHNGEEKNSIPNESI